jgi:Luciferase-like monooxygenase
MDPLVVLSAAAAVTKTLKLGTGVCLVVQRDPIQTAKLVASIQQVSGGRFLTEVQADDVGSRSRPLDLLKRYRDMGVARVVSTYRRSRPTRRCQCSIAGAN